MSRVTDRDHQSWHRALRLRAEVPEKIPARDRKMTVYEDRQIPAILWYDKKLRYSIATHFKKAPLIFIVPGMGAAYNDPYAQFLQRVFYKAGFHVVCLSSPSHPNFITAASGSGVDGRSISADAAAKSVSRETTFLEDLWDKRLLLAHLAYLCDRLTLALREDRLYAHVIEVKARTADFKTEIKRRLVLSPLQEMSKIYKIAEELFLELVAGSRLALRLVGVKASDLVRVRPLALFEPYSDRPERLGGAIDEVRGKYGFGSVLTVREKMLDAVYAFEPRRGYVLKTADADDIIQAVRDVHEGKSVLDPSIARKLMTQLSGPMADRPIESLTPREMDVLRLAAHGYTNKAIGAQLNVSDRTVQGHLANIFGKLHVTTRTEAVMRAVALGWLSPIEASD